MEQRVFPTAEGLFKYLAKFMTNDQIRKLQGGLTTNMNECGNRVVTSVAVDKKNGAASCLKRLGNRAQSTTG